MIGSKQYKKNNKVNPGNEHLQNRTKSETGIANTMLACLATSKVYSRKGCMWMFGSVVLRWSECQRTTVQNVSFHNYIHYSVKL